jgi:hypothetical protein
MPGVIPVSYGRQYDNDSGHISLTSSAHPQAAKLTGMVNIAVFAAF